MGARRAAFVCATLGAVFLLLGAVGVGAAGGDAVRAAGWEESTPGRWNALPERAVEAAGGVFQARIVLAPGTAVEWEKKTPGPPGPDETLSVDMTCSGTNRSSRDYRRYEAHFPLSVTVVFGKDSVSLPWKTRLANFFRGLWHGLGPSGIRLTYAYGNVVPEGSMYRLGEERTVFILAGAEERGKEVRASRNVCDDFRAAYGRDPKGPVTRVVVEAERPSGEAGSIEADIRVSSPLLR